MTTTPIDPSLVTHEAAVHALMVKRAALEAEQLALHKLDTSDVNTARLAAITDELGRITRDLAALAHEVTPGTTAATESVERSATKEQAVAQAPPSPPPPPGTVAVRNVEVKPDDIVTYMTLTQHLNPYGRKRQCDIDLENIVFGLDQVVNHEMYIHTERIKKLIQL